jgi:hypothetical protein
VLEIKRTAMFFTHGKNGFSRSAVGIFDLLFIIFVS